jgi:hypothetical protein
MIFIVSNRRLPGASLNGELGASRRPTGDLEGCSKTLPAYGPGSSRRSRMLDGERDRGGRRQPCHLLKMKQLQDGAPQNEE